MILTDLVAKGYFPKELPPCFITTEFANKFNQINIDYAATENNSLSAIVNTIRRNRTIPTSDRNEQIIKAKQIFKTRLKFSDCTQFTIPKVGLARNTIKIPTPLHFGRLAEAICNNYTQIELLFDDSKLSTTKPVIETETGEGKRSVKHESYAHFKEISILNSFKYQIHLKTDISKFYSSIYTHTIPWVTFGGKDKYKRNRVLAQNDPTRVNNIYGDIIDDTLQWCQNQQTMGIPIGPDTSLIVAEVLACHLDKLFAARLKRKSIDWVGYRYYDDYSLYFNSELDAQTALSILREVLSEFEIKINDEKTVISKSAHELEKDWALALKSFFFRPSEKDQKEDIWNFFSIAFKYAKENPKESVLKLALNKFSFVRIEKENWDYFESLLFRLGLVEPSSLAKLSKILISYKNLVSKKKLKLFCFEMINRHFEKTNDYELTWASWLLKEFAIQPTKDVYMKIFKSKSVCASVIGLDLINQNTIIRTFDYSDVEQFFETENLNTQYWLLVYECVFKHWLPFIPNSIVTDHFYFNILRNNGVYFYDENKRLEPLRVEKSFFDKIERKIEQVNQYITHSKFNNQNINAEITALFRLLLLNNQRITREEIQTRLEASSDLIKKIIAELETIKQQQVNFEDKRIYFVLGKRLEELNTLASKEINLNSKEDKNLLFDPEYD